MGLTRPEISIASEDSSEAGDDCDIADDICDLQNYEGDEVVGDDLASPTAYATAKAAAAKTANGKAFHKALAPHHTTQKGQTHSADLRFQHDQARSANVLALDH